MRRHKREGATDEYRVGAASSVAKGAARSKGEHIYGMVRTSSASAQTGQHVFRRILLCFGMLRHRRADDFPRS